MMIRTFLIHIFFVCYLHSCFGIGDIDGDSVCSAGQYGPGCRYNCSSSCDFDKCRISHDKGVPECNKGCKTYHTGFFCQEFCPSLCLNCSQLGGICQKCVDGFYGQTCNQTCDKDCLNGTCHIIYGVCILAPVAGGNNTRVKRATGEKLCWNGDEDGKVCQCCRSGRRGDRCELICQNCQTFYIPNSFCEYQCKTGYYGNTCDKECPKNCQPGNSGKPLCKATIDGLQCINGCKKGYTGRLCNESCSDNCKNATCFQRDGRCVDCLNGKYSEMCNRNCSEGCKDNACNIVDGKCVHGCKPGYYDMKCNSKCSDGCQENICSDEDGSCFNGCNIGYYKDDCTGMCGGNCTNNKCENDFDGANPTVTFLCSEGCKNGYQGRSCDHLCPNHCLICKQLDGCVQCDDGYNLDRGADGQPSCVKAISNKKKEFAMSEGILTAIIIVIVIVIIIVIAVVITLACVIRVLKRREHPSTTITSTDPQLSGVEASTDMKNNRPMEQEPLVDKRETMAQEPHMENRVTRENGPLIENEECSDQGNNRQNEASFTTKL